MKVEAGRVVRIECELRVKGGDVIESSAKSGPVEYKQGGGQMIRGLEAALEGLEAGEEKSGTIEAAAAFGTKESQPTMKIPRDAFPKDAELEEGAEFEAKGPTGTPVKLEVLVVEDDVIKARVVHPLADKDLEYKVKVLSVRPPPPPVPKVEKADDLLVEDTGE
jgi:FKBP-type peptidyl-prolyl cis-trans isomerase SlyD